MVDLALHELVVQCRCLNAQLICPLPLSTQVTHVAKT